jgi:hypothetical protein
MTQPPEREPSQEIPLFPFVLASRFDSRETSQAPYDAIQNIVRNEEVDFSVFRLIQNWPESLSKAPPSTKRWFVVVLGETPALPMVQEVTEALNMGEPVDIPDEAVAEMAQRRLKEIAQRPFTEIHRKPTIIKKDVHRREKMKRKLQQRSRRHNQGK